LLDIKAFVKRHDAEGNPLSSFMWSSVRDPLPLDVQEYLEEHGWKIETPE
jgi:hypothetical protein